MGGLKKSGDGLGLVGMGEVDERGGFGFGGVGYGIGMAWWGMGEGGGSVLGWKWEVGVTVWRGMGTRFGLREGEWFGFGGAWWCGGRWNGGGLGLVRKRDTIWWGFGCCERGRERFWALGGRRLGSRFWLSLVGFEEKWLWRFGLWG
ncbi:uncharacterized protein G2W53_014666 [Senna tora]|uniref:Uncharacterized protein n=1 Tax=Senna tora TaxID=362788 RepID=A0A834WUE8_9FABA|nr:uncharacterized protein G2W53_014666 [Senna tora]